MMGLKRCNHNNVVKIPAVKALLQSVALLSKQPVDADLIRTTLSLVLLPSNKTGEALVTRIIRFVILLRFTTAVSSIECDEDDGE